MFTYQTRFEHAKPVELSSTPPTPEELSLSVELCGKVQQALDTLEAESSTFYGTARSSAELLSHVFLLVDDARPDFKQRSSGRDSLCLTPRIFRKGMLPAPVTLSHVSADWRAVALDTTSLWNWIDVRGGGAELRRVGTWLARSGGLPLHLHVTIEASHPPSDIADMIVPYLQRVKDIQTVIQSSTGIEFLSRLANASDPTTDYQLRVLKVHYSQRSSRFSGAVLRLGEHARSLFSRLDLLVLSGVGISGWPEWQVKKACIYLMGDLGRQMTWNKVLGPVLWGLPLLKELNVGILYDLEYETPSNDVPPAIATFPSLSGMKIQTTFRNFERLLAIMEAPKLSSLEFQCYHSFDGHVDISSMANFVRRHTALQQLTLDTSGGEDDLNLVAVMESFPYAPSLEMLTLIASHGSADLLLTRVRSVLQNLPNIKYFRFNQMDFSLGALKSFLRDVQQPLTVYLDGGFVGAPSESYPDAPALETIPSLVQADLETLARTLSDRDILLAWSETTFVAAPES
ncbi:hypothetical protein FRC04_009771 [Tulasnella sp. 424]|nr:hypothetical protein FRC04_009771 [Tulasnella sp. 424]KAG8971141.1 hypothetical protein FRC05_011425 [Tulasnella sp. 425]